MLVGGVGGSGLYDCCKDVRRSLLNKLNKNGRMHLFDAEAGWDLYLKKKRGIGTTTVALFLVTLFFCSNSHLASAGNGYCQRGWFCA